MNKKDRAITSVPDIFWPNKLQLMVLMSPFASVMVMCAGLLLLSWWSQVYSRLAPAHEAALEDHKTINRGKSHRVDIAAE